LLSRNRKVGLAMVSVGASHMWMFMDDDDFQCERCGRNADFDTATSGVKDCPVPYDPSQADGAIYDIAHE